ncbi:MAG: hypothetical protein FJ267_12530, partial [Planctomycetes bacterium]|nr:hypothetical protein [Planctomycetota bacterium]
MSEKPYDTINNSFSRRELLRATTLGSVVAIASEQVAAATTSAPEKGTVDDVIPALLPRDQEGRHFVFYSDCCSGIPGAPNEQSHAAINGIVSRIRPEPEFIAFPGDSVMGYIDDYEKLRSQWNYWYDTEMAWLKKTRIPLYQSTSNHNTYDDGSERVFREVHPTIPQNGPDHQQGLAWYIRNGNLLYVSTHQPDRTRPYRRQMKMETEWLADVLRQHADVPFKFVVGHYPVFPVNGYTQYPQWSFRPEERTPFWNVLVENRVTAYLCSHILAFDVQIHQGIPQILSGGAGTMGSGPLALMPTRTESLHASQVAVDRQGIQVRTLQTNGQFKDAFVWPFHLASPESRQWPTIESSKVVAEMSRISPAGKAIAWRFQGVTSQTDLTQQTEVLLCGWDAMEGVATIRVAFEGYPAR